MPVAVSVTRRAAVAVEPEKRPLAAVKGQVAAAGGSVASPTGSSSLMIWTAAYAVSQLGAASSRICLLRAARLSCCATHTRPGK